MRDTQLRSLGREDPLEKEMATHSILLPGESHGGRSLVGYNPWRCKESDTTERLHFTFTYKHIQGPEKYPRFLIFLQPL